MSNSTCAISLRLSKSRTAACSCYIPASSFSVRRSSVVRVANDLVARIEGKALSIATPIPTPNGWATMGDLGVGDFVFDLSGEPVRIKDATAVMFGRPCWEVTFSDGTTIIADEAHQWMTTTKARRGRHAPPSIKSTGLIAQSLRYGCEYNHHVPLAHSVRCPPVELPIDPYVLGIWLGDGTSASAEITTADDEILDEIRRCWVRRPSRILPTEVANRRRRAHPQRPHRALCAE